MKRKLRALLEGRHLGQIAEMAVGSRRVLGMLFAKTYDADPVMAWRAVEATGVAAARIAQEDPEYVRDHLRKLHWLLCEESGGVGWRAPETMAEIVSQCPALQGDYVPIVTHLIVETAEEDLGYFRAGMLWAIGRLGGLAAGHDDVLPAVTGALGHPDSQVRGIAVWTLGRLGRAGELENHAELRSDDGAVDLFEDGTLRRTTVRGILADTLEGTR